MTHSAWWLTCDALAVYRLAVLVTRDGIFEPLRERIRLASYDDTGTSVGILGWLRDLLSCAWCVSVWAAAAVTALTVAVPQIWQFPAFGLALSAAAGFLSERT